MEVRISHFFIILLAIVLFSIVFIKPKSIKNFYSNEIATFEFSNFNIYKITKEKLDLVLMASNGYSFKDKTIIKNLSIAHFLQKGKLEYLTSNEAILKNDNLNLRNKATYTRNDGLYISTKNLNYDFKKEIVKSKEPFTIDFLINSGNLSEQKHTFKGEGFVFYKKDNKITADNIKAVINLK